MTLEIDIMMSTEIKVDDRVQGKHRTQNTT